jgi:ribulose-phosphate 3-epimerase
MAIVAPSILSADFARLGEEIESVSAAEWIHVDVMDGRFVPNITIGPLVVKALRPLTDKFIDCHLMIEDPDNYVADFAEAGADLISVHAEASRHLDRSIQAIKQAGAQAGIALNPHTPESVLDYVLEELDLVLVMSVNPGFGGQSLISRVFPKIERIRKRIDALGLSTLIQVDGGVKTHNASDFTNAGAHVLVSGSGVFKADDRTEAIRALQRA